MSYDLYGMWREFPSKVQGQRDASSIAKDRLRGLLPSTMQCSWVSNMHRLPQS